MNRESIVIFYCSNDLRSGRLLSRSDPSAVDQTRCVGCCPPDSSAAIQIQTVNCAPGPILRLLSRFNPSAVVHPIPRLLSRSNRNCSPGPILRLLSKSIRRLLRCATKKKRSEFSIGLLLPPMPLVSNPIQAVASFTDPAASVYCLIDQPIFRCGGLPTGSATY